MAITAGEDILAADLVQIRKIIVTASENLTAGNPVGISNLVNNYVAKASTNSREVTITPTAEVGSGQYPVACEIGTDKFAVLYKETTTGYLRVVVATVSYSNFSAPFTFGTPVTVSTTGLGGDYDTALFDICKLDTDKIAIAYVESGANTVTRLVCATVSGTTVTLGTAVNFDSSANAVAGLTMCQIATDKAVVAVGKTGRFARAFTVSGTTATIGASATTGSNLLGGSMASCKIGTDKFVIVDDTTGYAQVCTISGTTITAGTQSQFSSSTTPLLYMLNVFSPTTDKFVISYCYSGANRHLRCATVSGTTITYGTDVDTGNTSGGSILNVSSSEFQIVRSDGLASYGVSGTTLTLANTLLITPMGNPYMRKGWFNFATAWVLAGWGDTTFTYFIKGMSNNFIGFAQSTVSRNATVEVVVNAAIDSNQSGLTAGARYKISDVGMTLISAEQTVNSLDDLNTVLAINATEVILK